MKIRQKYINYTFFQADLIQGTQIKCQKCMLSFEKSKLLQFYYVDNLYFKYCFNILQIKDGVPFFVHCRAKNMLVKMLP